MLEKERMGQLFQKFVMSQDMPDDDLTELSLEELTYIYAVTEATRKDENLKEQVKAKGINIPIRQQIIYWRVVETLKKADCLYVAYTENPMYPYLDEARNALAFSAEDIAAKMASHLLEVKKTAVTIRRIENKMITPFLVQMYYCGIEQIIIDNGGHPMIVKRTDILPEPEWNEEMKKQQVYNGRLQSFMIQFTQMLRASKETKDEKRLRLLDLMEKRMVIELVEAKFLVPMVILKDGVPVKPGTPVPQGENVARRIPNLADANDQSKWIPAFTDWSEFAKLYKPTEWGAIIVNYDALLKLTKDTTGQIVINAKGCGYRLSPQTIERINQFIQRKKEADARKAEEGDGDSKRPTDEKVEQEAHDRSGTGAVKEEPVTYGELLEEPEMMMAALKKLAKGSRVIKRMWLAQRIEGEDKGYYFVVDAKAGAGDVVEKLKTTAAGYLEGKTLEFSLATPTALSTVCNIVPFYKKGIFG